MRDKTRIATRKAETLIMNLLSVMDSVDACADVLVGSVVEVAGDQVEEHIGLRAGQGGTELGGPEIRKGNCDDL